MKTRMQTSVNKKTLLLALLLATNSAWAVWVKVGENDSGVIYIDPETIRKEGNLRKVWQLMDLKQRDKEGVMSRRMRFEYDCNQERYRFMSISSHSAPMAGGTMLTHTANESPGLDIAPETAPNIILKIVCTQ